MADILVVVSRPCSKAEVMASANLSYDQVQKYLPALQKLKLVNEYIEDRSHSKWIITEKGLEYLQCTLTEYGRIAKGQHSIWSMERETADELTNRASETKILMFERKSLLDCFLFRNSFLSQLTYDLLSFDSACEMLW